MPKTTGKMGKVQWSGRIASVQPRIRLMRSFDERSHSYLGYVLRIEGTCKDVSYTEEDWVDEDTISHRGSDE